ncbi:hypothetical protein SAMN05421640_2380 [Ekhidna lutea]|uniref:SGNH/GDSL hydrolase family protein n=1 Tax=Ekhidna lutea TaxID=447679 RepID=A0A239K3T6_EKHLU|nr:hypothetical protein [Ekhidna lutea]SNT12329.1 hypothetical protein SAMN05421640_2380 [Ekhidna lutea]
MRTRFVTSILLLLFFNGKGNSQDTLKALFVGNSYVYMSDIPALTSSLSEGTKTYIITLASTAGGARLSNHWNNDGDLNTKQKIADGAFDFVILQEQSTGTLQKPDEFYQHVGLFSSYCRKKGAEPVLYQTWAKEYAPNTQTQISDAYEKAALNNSATLAPVGDVWAIVRKENPEINLFLDDGSHQSNFGAFLVACIMVKVLTGELPDKESILESNPKIPLDHVEAILDAVNTAFN